MNDEGTGFGVDIHIGSPNNSNNCDLDFCSIGASMITSRDRRMYALAVKIAKDSECADQHGAVIAKGARVLAVATNTNGISKQSALWFKVTGHAEQNALLRNNLNSYGATIYSARISPQNGTDISKPCEMCEWMMLQYNVEKAVYSDGWMLRELTH